MMRMDDHKILFSFVLVLPGVLPLALHSAGTALVSAGRHGGRAGADVAAGHHRPHHRYGAGA